MASAHFEQLYHGIFANSKYCQGTNVSQEYVCPKVTAGRIEEMPLHPWFAKQGGNQKECHGKSPILGRYNLCPNQSLYTHNQAVPQYQADPRIQSSNRGGNCHIKKKKPEQRGGYVVQANPEGQSSIPPTVPVDNPYENYPAQDGYFLKRCVGSRNLHPSRNVMSVDLKKEIDAGAKIAPLRTKMIIESTGMPPDTIVSVVPPKFEGFISSLNLPVETPEELTNHYISGSNLAPGYYPNVAADHIGKRPVYSARILEADIPKSIVVNRKNWPDRDAGCLQPNWGFKCI
jgi:hypothetical protein